MVNSFRNSLEHLQYLLQIPILPTSNPAKVKSICLLGSGHFKQGIPGRPELQRQKETLDTITAFLTPGPNGTAQSFWNHPEVPKRPAEIAPRIAAPTDNTSAARNRRYNKRRQEIKPARILLDLHWHGLLELHCCWFGLVVISHHLLSSQDVLPRTELGRALLLQPGCGRIGRLVAELFRLVNRTQNSQTISDLIGGLEQPRGPILPSSVAGPTELGLVCPQVSCHVIDSISHGLLRDPKWFVG